MARHTILFLAANPFDTDRLALDLEARAIEHELERSRHRDRLELVTRWAVQPLDLLRELRKLAPTVVHFSGHGVRSSGGGPSGFVRRDIMGAVGPRRDVQHGLLFQRRDGTAQRVTTAALRATFGAAGGAVRLVVLSACYSDAHAAVLETCVDGVVGIDSPIGDDAARAFAVGFYRAVGDRRSVTAAYREGKAAMCSKGFGDAELRLRHREGVDLECLVLVDAS